VVLERLRPGYNSGHQPAAGDATDDSDEAYHATGEDVEAWPADAAGTGLS
jgi:hypothetical protein